MNVVSTSRVAPEWRPISTTVSVHVWDKGEGGCVAQSLVHDLLLPEDVNAFEESTDENMGRRLQWNTIAVISCFLVYH